MDVYQVLTYFFHMYAEWYKKQLRSRRVDLLISVRENNDLAQEKSHRFEHMLIDRLILRSRITFELLIPTVSVSCLLLVTGLVSYDAVRA